jgi:aminotransferase in exopolysaccharide biosynthesis|tara:strand:+ start:1018 stop:2169 length:1152 start_codon:yes stop_codon:yes gene_type:complete
MIPLSVPNLCGNELKYVKRCIKTEWISSVGHYIPIFEKKVASYLNSKYAVGCINGTSALQVALRILEVGKGDEVIVPTLTFVATINSVIYNNAKPIFMDCDDFYNIDAEKTIKFIKNETVFRNNFTFNKKTRKRIPVILPVHLWGNAAKLEELVKVCKKRNISIVEDAAESFGSKYINGNLKNRFTGTIGKVGCLSFNGNKMITTGGGGMILTSDKKLAEKAKYLVSQAKDNALRYIHNDIGYNFRLTNIQAALGLAQLENFKFFKKKKDQIYQFYKNEISKIKGLSIAALPKYADNNKWLNILKINSKIYKKNVLEIIMKLKKNNIEARPIWYPNHLQKKFKSYQKYEIKNAIKLLNSSLCVPSSTNIKISDLKKVVKALNV